MTIQRWIKRQLRQLGYDLVPYRTFQNKPDPERPWEDDPDFLAHYHAVVGHTLVDRQRLFILYQLAQHTVALEGNLAECGVYRGGTALLLAKLKPANKKLYLFDTFGGMPETDSQKDYHKAGDFSDTSLPQVQQLLDGQPNVIFRPGFFPATATGLEHETFCMAHCDMDIYTSILSFCHFFYPRLTRRGVLVFDDYGSASCPGAKAAVREFCTEQGLIEIYLPTGQALIWKS
jgi:O-methyltransferase